MANLLLRNRQRVNHFFQALRGDDPYAIREYPATRCLDVGQSANFIRSKVAGGVGATEAQAQARSELGGDADAVELTRVATDFCSGGRVVHLPAILCVEPRRVRLELRVAPTEEPAPRWLLCIDSGLQAAEHDPKTDTDVIDVASVKQKR